VKIVRIMRVLVSLVFVSSLDLEVITAEEQTPTQPAPSPHPTLSLTLRGAIEAAADNNPDVLLYKERIEAARGQVRTQLGPLLPNLSANVRQSRMTVFQGTFGLSPVRSDPFSIFDARVFGSQNLLSVSLFQRWRASRETLHVTEFESDTRKFDTMASVALFYMEGLKGMAMVKMHEANQQIMRELLAMVKQRLRGGVATGLDIARLEAQIDHERQQSSTARYDATRAMLNMVNLLGIPFDVTLSLTDELKSEVGAVPLTQAAVEEAIARRPEVQAQYKRVQASELTYSSITGERLPSLVAQGEYGLIGNRWDNTLDTYLMSVLMQIPIFDGGQREGRIAEARSQLRQEALRMRSVLNQVKLEVSDALAALSAAGDQVGIAQSGMLSATKELELARERFAVITAASQFEVTNALYSVARARENVVNALFQLNAARVNFARATGTLNALN
jgi:outer membrane protein TolC